MKFKLYNKASFIFQPKNIFYLAPIFPSHKQLASPQEDQQQQLRGATHSLGTSVLGYEDGDRVNLTFRPEKGIRTNRYGLALGLHSIPFKMSVT
jgi:hypothetical protein